MQPGNVAIEDAPTKARRSPQLTIVTNSEVTTFRSCPQLHHFSYREKLRPKVEAKPLAVGSIIHAGMSAGLRAGWAPGWQGRSVDDRRRDQIAAALQGIDDKVMTWAGEVMTNATTELNFESLSAEVDQMAEVVKFLLEHYFAATTSDLTDFVLVETEAPFLVGIRNKSGILQHLKLNGVRDAVMYDPLYNQVVLMEHKTAGSDPRGVERRVEMDPQTTGYAYALREQLNAGLLKCVDGKELRVADGVTVGRTIYNVLRKSKPREPNINKDGSVSAAAIDTTADIYAAALNRQVTERMIPTSVKQVELLEKLRGQGDRYFARLEYFRTPEEIERWRSEMYVDAARIREADRDPTRRTRNTGHCNMPWSLKCSYRSICMDPDAPELYTLFKRIDDAHAEVREAEVDLGGGEPHHPA